MLNMMQQNFRYRLQLFFSNKTDRFFSLYKGKKNQQNFLTKDQTEIHRIF